ncbi:MAG: hypothetical protein LBR21_05595 [Propionibacteriaceae bacterium]|jgi:hypothetical protein|nr:hypothetical protein [Propionibacteriaceae bacterium]
MTTSENRVLRALANALGVVGLALGVGTFGLHIYWGVGGKWLPGGSIPEAMSERFLLMGWVAAFPMLALGIWNLIVIPKLADRLPRLLAKIARALNWLAGIGLMLVAVATELMPVPIENIAPGDPQGGDIFSFWFREGAVWGAVIVASMICDALARRSQRN